MNYLSMGCFIKNENRYLREWVEFHRIQGVEHFYVVCNDGDPTTAMNVLLPYKEHITFKHFPEKPAAYKQMDAYNWIIEESRDKSRWVAFIDLDEFLMPTSTQSMSLVEILGDYESSVGLVVNWVNYGSSNLYFQPELQTEEFLYRAYDFRFANKYFKSIVDPTKVVKAVNPHSFYYLNNEWAIDQFNQRVMPGLCYSINDLYFGKRLRVNHYRLRSWIDYLEKIERWRGNEHPELSELEGQIRYWKDSNTNEVHDDTALRYVEEVKRRLRSQC